MAQKRMSPSKQEAGRALSEVAAHTSRGGLHRSLGIPEGQNIPESRIEAATHSDNPKVRRQANLAQTYAKYRKKG